MCEIFGISANRKVKINELLRIFFSHGIEHPDGWGIAICDDGNVSIEKEPVKVSKSKYLKSRINSRIASGHTLAHIRKATIGHAEYENTHPFTSKDASGRSWTLVHNGTIFESDKLVKYQYEQKGSTDSERILLYIIDRVNALLEEELNGFDVNARVELIEEIAKELSEGNKLNFILSDGEYMYIHKNADGTLYRKQEDGYAIFSTKPLDNGRWDEISDNTLLVYNNGKLVYTGEKHNHTYVEDLEKINMIYLAYSGL